jgi:membrane fusion protein, adhesin transport system
MAGKTKQETKNTGDESPSSVLKVKDKKHESHSLDLVHTSHAIAHTDDYHGNQVSYADSNLLFTKYLVKTPRSARTFAYVLVALFLLLIIILFWVPWVQTVSAKGRVTSLAPNERPQFIQAQITGRLVAWRVKESQYVNPGDTIAILEDIDSKFLDPSLLRNSNDQVLALEERAVNAEKQISAFRKQVQSEEQARDASVRAAQEAYNQSIQRKIALEAQLKQEKLNFQIATQRYKDRKELFDKGLRSLREFERATLEQQEAEVKLDRVEADLQGAKNAVSQAEATVKNRLSDGQSKVLKAIADESKALETLSSINNSLAKARSELNNAIVRRGAAVVTSAIQGRVVRLYSFGPGETVKQGDALAMIAPETKSLAVELYVSGNDAPLISKGRHVRVQFDGFPAFQISGFPGVRVGTFGGEVVLVDAVDDDKAKGMFRVLIKPDEQHDEQWPQSDYLRPGTQASGWMLLNTVSLGWEIWRQFNGFPPSVVKPASAGKPPRKFGSSDDKKDDKDSGGDDDKK